MGSKAILVAFCSLAACAFGLPAENKRSGILSSIPIFNYVGRVNPLTKQLTWPSTGVSFSFTGTTATIGINNIIGTSSADMIIDGGQPLVIPNVAGSSISTPTLAHGTHSVVLRKRSETVFGTFNIGNITSDGSANLPSSPSRRIEVVGDSISVGYGLDGTYPCTNTAAVEDNPMTYAALAAKAVGADYSTIAWSGKGLIRNIESSTPDTSPLMPELYTRYGANDADNSYPFLTLPAPGAVVITLGTNDWSYYGVRSPINATDFTNGMVAFVKTIESKYPFAQFFLLSSPMLSDAFPTTADAQHTTQVNALKAAVAQLGTKAHFVDWPTQGSAVGCDFHPNAATHAQEGQVLAAAIKSALNW